ncbi:MAG: thioredoxin domain-containing protein [Candidatus Acidiferrales bacterium]
MNLRRLLPILTGAALVIAAFSVRSLRAAAQDTTAAEEARLSAEKSLGSPSAPIKLIVYDDYECPACGNFYEQTLRQLIDTYVAEGKVYLVHRDFPLPMHQYSRQAARWVNAAARIGKFEAVERALFDNQMAWSEYGSANPKGNIKPLVQQALTPTEFKRVERLMQGCESDSHDEIKGCVVDAQIQRDIAAGALLPITQTPTFVVSYKGQSYPPAAGGVSWALLKQFFDQLLSQK